ncbi:hypothetical protein EJP82_25960 [Paenibacillus anaericanus]|uniref:Uncharacterized protein n=1 Tax=Paenibacillus anaericanus TaxID=170367 RepID=A0A3S1C0V0_9BACL|nr:hypothetical protein [Paenibacillus anaericanus]RUT39528.1 hypothetical protein EJP82_25960 [Paenibacillus anaericanus]
MSNLLKFLFTLVAWILFMVAGIPYLTTELTELVKPPESISNEVIAAPYVGPADLTVQSGAQVIGLVPYALAGDFDLYIDEWPPINQETDISTFNLKGVTTLNYKVSIIRDPLLGTVKTIDASH